MSKRSYWLLVPASFCCLLVAGCDRGTYFAETVVHPDGSARRTMIQPVEYTPTPILDPKAWDQVTYCSGPDELIGWGWPNPIASLPPRKRPAQVQYFAARREAPTVGQIPDHVVIAPPEGIKVQPGRLIREYARTDHGVLVEHRWKETLTDCVTLADMRNARAELVDLLSDLALDVFKTVYEGQYDASGLAQWWKTEGKQWFAEFTELMFDPATSREDSRLKEALAALCSRHGLILGEPGTPIVSDKVVPAIESFLQALIQKHVRRKDGSALDQQSAERLYTEIKAGGSNQRFDQTYKDLAARKYGGKESLEIRLASLATRVFGLYFPFGGNLHFDDVVSLPGEVVETNGAMLSKNRVRWRFDASQAYPLGFAMTCRSIEIDPVLLALLNGGTLSDRKAKLEFARLVSEQAPLRKVLQECCKARNLKPLSDYRSRIIDRPDAAAETARLERLRKLLKLKLE